jgi:hypothetical protein
MASLGEVSWPLSLNPRLQCSVPSKTPNGLVTLLHGYKLTTWADLVRHGREDVCPGVGRSAEGGLFRVRTGHPAVALSVALASSHPAGAVREARL